MSKAVVTAGNTKVPETDAGYANARLRGMRSHLLPREFYERLIEAPDMTQMVKDLMDTVYGPDLEANVVHGFTAAVIDEALKENMVRAYRKVLSFVHPEARKLLSTLLGKWDVFNIKTILRGAHNHVSFDEIKTSFFPAGYMGADELEALLREKLTEREAVTKELAELEAKVKSSGQGYLEQLRTLDQRKAERMTLFIPGHSPPQVTRAASTTIHNTKWLAARSAASSRRSRWPPCGRSR